MTSGAGFVAGRMLVYCRLVRPTLIVSADAAVAANSNAKLSKIERIIGPLGKFAFPLHHGRWGGSTDPTAIANYHTAFAAARPALRPENRQPPRKVPSSER